MKLLGRFLREIALQYENLLNQSGIRSVIEDTSNVNTQVAGAPFPILVDFFVEENNVEKAEKIIKNFESSAYQKVKQESESLDKVVKIIFAILFFLIFIYILGNCIGWW